MGEYDHLTDEQKEAQGLRFSNMNGEWYDPNNTEWDKIKAREAAEAAANEEMPPLDQLDLALQTVSRLDPIVFNEYVLKDEQTGASITLDKFQKDWFSALNTSRFLNLIIPPEHGKTVNLSIGYVLWLIGNNPGIRIVIVHRTEGMAVKVLMPCFHPLPVDLEYRFIWMDRESGAHADSNRKFIEILKRKPKSEIMSRREFRERHGIYTKKGLEFLKTYTNAMTIRLRFEAVLKKPVESARRMADFLDMDLDIGKMTAIVEPRSPRCYKGFLELQSEV